MTQLTLNYASVGRSISAEQFDRVDTATMRRRIYEALRTYGPCTADALAATLRLPLNSVAPRLTELGKSGKVRRTGERRDTRSGGRAVVLEVCE